MAWVAALLVGAALIRPISDHVAWLARAARYETTHVVAHLFLYGTLAALARAAGLSPWRAAALTLAVAAGQEAVQLLTALPRRAPGWPEGFDLLVDAVGVAVVLGAERLRVARFSAPPVLPEAASSPTSEVSSPPLHARGRRRRPAR